MDTTDEAQLKELEVSLKDINKAIKEYMHAVKISRTYADIHASNEPEK